MEISTISEWWEVSFHLFNVSLINPSGPGAARCPEAGEMLVWQGQRCCLAASHWAFAAVTACKAALAEPLGLLLTLLGGGVGLVWEGLSHLRELLHSGQV